jgi:hypothetical protein
MKENDCQIRFARHAFENLQGLIRFADTKGGGIAVFVFALAATGIPMTTKGAEALRFRQPFPMYLPEILFLVTWICFSFASVLTLWKLLSKLILPRYARYRRHQDMRQLLYWEHIKQFDSNDAYFENVRKMDEELELRNITDQVRELALIADTKMMHLASLKQSLFIIGISWSIGTTTTIYLISRGCQQ